MADAGLPVRFGWFLVPEAADPPGLVEQVRLAERAGVDLVGIQDHPYQRRYLDTFSLLAALATATERIGLFPDVANLPLRHPAMLAKAAASIDLLSGGRFELGLGAGSFWDAIVAMGGPRRSPGEAVEALDAAPLVGAHREQVFGLTVRGDELGLPVFIECHECLPPRAVQQSQAPQAAAMC